MEKRKHLLNIYNVRFAIMNQIRMEHMQASVDYALVNMHCHEPVKNTKCESTH